MRYNNLKDMNLFISEIIILRGSEHFLSYKVYGKEEGKFEVTCRIDTI
jgi:hypothetical protein